MVKRVGVRSVFFLVDLVNKHVRYKLQEVEVVFGLPILLFRVEVIIN